MCPSDSAEYLAGGLDIGGPQGGRRRGERPSWSEVEDPPQEFSPDSVCGECGMGLKPWTNVCRRGGVCEVMRRRAER